MRSVAGLLPPQLRPLGQCRGGACLLLLVLLLAILSAPLPVPAQSKTEPSDDMSATASAPAASDQPKDAAGPQDSVMDKTIPTGSQPIHVKPGSIDDVSAVGHRQIGSRGILGNWYSADAENRLGKGYAGQIEKATHMITDAVVVGYVNHIAQKIVANSDCKASFTVRILDADQINAVALPGGYLFVNSGLILNAADEAELAGVLAHETAHVCAHHVMREMTRASLAELGMMPVILLGGWTGYGIYAGAQLALPVSLLKFSREFETQADYLGVQYMYLAGYDPQAMITFFERVQALARRKPGLVSAAFSDHPQTPDRILHTQKEIGTILPARDTYLVTTSEFATVQARLATLEHKRDHPDPAAIPPTITPRAIHP